MENFTLSSKRWFAAVLMLLASHVVFAATYTAAASGAWNNAATWGGTAPAYNIGSLDQVYIPSGITVTLDNTVIVDGLLTVLNVEGGLTSAGQNGNLIINSGTFSGGGTVSLTGVIFNGGTVSFDGTVSCTTLTSSTTNLQLAAEITVHEMMTLSSGTFHVVSGGMFLLDENGVIVINSGTMVLNGGNMGLTNSYDVKYSQGSSASGFELDGSGLRSVTVDVGNGNTVTMNSDIDMQGTLTLTTGTLILNGNDLTINGGISSSGTGRIQSTQQSDISIVTTGSNGTLSFTNTGNAVANFRIDVGQDNWLVLGSDVNVHGTLHFVSGGINADGHRVEIKSGGAITGAGEHSYIVTGSEGALGMQVAASGSTFVNFPVGTSSQYMPAGVQMGGGSSSAVMWIGAAGGIMSQGTSGTDWSADSAVVNGTWFVEPDASASNVNANIRFGWKSDLEVNGFDRGSALVKHYRSGAWQMVGGASAATEADGMYMLQADNVTSFSPFAIFEAGPASIHEAGNTLALDIFPNPAAERINVRFGADVTGVVNMDIVDAAGRVMNNYKLTGNDQGVDISHLPPGKYFVRFFTQELHAVKKVVKL